VADFPRRLPIRAELEQSSRARISSEGDNKL